MLYTRGKGTSICWKKWYKNACSTHTHTHTDNKTIMENILSVFTYGGGMLLASILLLFAAKIKHGLLQLCELTTILYFCWSFQLIIIVLIILSSATLQVNNSQHHSVAQCDTVWHHSSNCTGMHNILGAVYKIGILTHPDTS